MMWLNIDEVKNFSSKYLRIKIKSPKFALCLESELKIH